MGKGSVPALSYGIDSLDYERKGATESFGHKN